MDEEKQFPDEVIIDVVNKVINDSAVDDSKMEDANEAMIKVLKCEIQLKTAATQYEIPIDVLGALVQAATRRLKSTANGSAKATKKQTNAKGKRNAMSGFEPEAEGDHRVEDEVKQQENDGGKKKEVKIDGRKRKSTVNEPVNAKKAEENNETPENPHQPRKKRRRNGLDPKQTDTTPVNNNSDLESLNMALDLYRGGTTPQQSVAQQRTRRSIASTNLVKTPATMKALTWSDKHPTEDSSSQQQNLTTATIEEEVTSSLKGRIIRDNPRWLQFPQVVEDAVNEVVMRMREKQATMKEAILSNIRDQNPLKDACTEYGVGLSTLRRYSRETKVLLETYLGAEVRSDDFLKQFDAATVTLDHIRSCAIHATQSPRSSMKDRKNSKHVPPPPTIVTPSPTKSANKRTSVPHQVPIIATNNNNNNDSSSTSSQSSTIGNATPSLEMVPHLLTQPEKHQILLTRRQRARISFNGTRDEFRTLVTGQLNGRYVGNVGQLAELVSNYLHAEYSLRRQQDLFSIPYHLLQASCGLLARYIELENLVFTDVEEYEEDGNTQEY